jgi:hypothetical protein
MHENPWPNLALLGEIQEKINGLKVMLADTGSSNYTEDQKHLIDIVVHSSRFYNNAPSLADLLAISKYHQQPCAELTGQFNELFRELLGKIVKLNKSDIDNANECKRAAARLKDRQQNRQQCKLFELIALINDSELSLDGVSLPDLKILNLAHLQYAGEYDATEEQSEESKSLLLGDDFNQLPDIEETLEAEDIALFLLLIFDDLKKCLRLNKTEFEWNSPSNITNPGRGRYDKKTAPCIIL